MTRRPLSPMPIYTDFSESGRLARLYGQWQRYSNQADLVVEVGERPQVNVSRELGQVAIIKGVLGDKYSHNPTVMPS